jgi:hypothetical protein
MDTIGGIIKLYLYDINITTTTKEAKGLLYNNL